MAPFSSMIGSLRFTPFIKCFIDGVARAVAIVKCTPVSINLLSRRAELLGKSPSVFKRVKSRSEIKSFKMGPQVFRYVGYKKTPVAFAASCGPMSCADIDLAYLLRW